MAEDIPGWFVRVVLPLLPLQAKYMRDAREIVLASIGYVNSVTKKEIGYHGTTDHNHDSKVIIKSHSWRSPNRRLHQTRSDLTTLAYSWL
jgi:hypothetical protein